MHQHGRTLIRGLVRTVDPANEPLSLTEAKSALRVEHADDDTIITAYIKAARSWAENITRKAFITQTWKMTIDRFPSMDRQQWWDGVVEAHINVIFRNSDRIEIAKPPLQSVTSLVTFNRDDSQSTFDASNYFVDTQQCPGRILLNTGATWPVNLRDHNSVQVTFVAGFGDDSTDIPEDLITAMRLMIAHLYENRGDDEASIKGPVGAKMLLENYIEKSLA